MKFKFSLEAVLHHRHALEQEARRQYHLAKDQVDSILKEINEMYGTLETMRREIQEKQEKGGYGVGAAIQFREEIMDGFLYKIEQKRIRARVLISEADEKRHLLLEASKEYKVLEKLKSRQWKEFKAKQLKHSIKMIDELVTMRHNRKEGS